MSEGTAPWWRTAVCYQVYVRSFADSDGDGIGDIGGLHDRLEYLSGLGVDAVWVTPFYPSPLADGGYDVSDYRDVDPALGTLAGFDAMLASAHALGVRVIIDIVPNHTSAAHPWFQAAVAAGAGSPERARYLFADGRGPHGERPPNRWTSIFGGPAWSRLPDGQWYLHLFDAGQPDLNWRNLEVVEEFDSVLRFWLDRGVDGLRIDVAHGLFKAEGLPDRGFGRTAGPAWNQPEVHEIYRRWHKLLAAYPGDRMAIGEAWVPAPADLAPYVRPDELQQAFNFAWLEAPWSAAAFRRVVEQTYAALGSTGASPTWVLSNHDVVRAVTRYGGGDVGAARARAALLAMLALPGSAYLYQGDELALPQVDVPEEDRRDPTWLRGGGVGRDGCRVPIPWTRTGAAYGFSPAGAAEPPWLPQPEGWGDLSIAAQEGDPDSTLTLVRRALALRRELVPALSVDVVVSSPRAGVLVAAREPGFACVLNCGSRPFRLGDDRGAVVLSSAEVIDGVLPPNAAAWLRR